MSKKTMLILIFLLIVFFVMFYFFLFYDFSEVKNKSVTNVVKENINLPKSDDKIEKTETKEKEVVAEEVKEEVEKNNNGYNLVKTKLEKKARFFVERLGTYSNQSQFENVKNLKMFMTDNMKEWADEYIQEGIKKEYSGEYVGITVKSISSNFVEFDNNKGVATIEINTQKIKSDTSGDGDAVREDVLVSFVRKDNKWLVDKTE